MTYMNQLIERTLPATRCQAAVYAVLSSEPSSVDEIWNRNPVYVLSKWGRVGPVRHGTISAVLKSLVQQGFAERVGEKYRIKAVKA